MRPLLPLVTLWALLLALALAAPARGDRTQERLKLPGGRELVFELITPEPFDPAATYPVAIILPGGPQTLAMAQASLNYLDPLCRERNWIVVSPATVGDRLYFNGAQQHIPALFADLRKRFKVEADRFHLLGVSNGGLSAFRVAIDHARDIRSLTVLPGYLPQKDDADKLTRLRGIPVRIFVGSDDQIEWVDASKTALAACQKAGLDVTLDIRGAQPHAIRNLSPKDLLDMLDGFRETTAAAASPQHAEVAAVLDQLHALAAQADEDGYFALFAPEGVFIGTDATERWNVAEFRAYAHPYFSKGKGWAYTPGVRHIDFSPDKAVAWFDELLDNAKYGTCRGTGVLRLIDGRYKIAQYHLTVPVPNSLMNRVAKLIEAEEKKRK